MRFKFFTALAYATLVVDAYLALAVVATKMAPPQAHYFLPPFGAIRLTEASRFLVLFIATWTAVLAIGCLRTSGEPGTSPYAAPLIWYVLVLALIWLVFLLLLLPSLVDLLWEWFVWGL